MKPNRTRAQLTAEITALMWAALIYHIKQVRRDIATNVNQIIKK